jgi:hypothetical protein
MRDDMGRLHYAVVMYTVIAECTLAGAMVLWQHGLGRFERWRANEQVVTVAAPDNKGRFHQWRPKLVFIAS